MILFAAAGFALYHFVGWKIAFPLAIFAGLLVAPLVPVKAGCSIKGAPKSEE